MRMPVFRSAQLSRGAFPKTHTQLVTAPAFSSSQRARSIGHARDRKARRSTLSSLRFTVVVKQVAASVFVAAVAVSAALAPPVGASATRPPADQSVVLDASFNQTVVDEAPAGPSVGDIEHDDGHLLDAAGHLLGTLRVTCVLTKLLPGGDALERCTGTASTTDGTVRLSGVGHLIPPNPPWQVTGLSGRYAGLHGRLSYEMDIPLGETPPGLIPAGRYDSVDIVEFHGAGGLRAGVVPRPGANAPFISHADSLCTATQRAGHELSPFPFSNFDPLHPDPTLLVQVGRFFDQPERRRLAPELLTRLAGLGPPPAQPAEWSRVLQARRAQIANRTAQVHAALADHPAAFARAVTRAGPVYNKLVLASAVFGVQACTFG